VAGGRGARRLAGWSRRLARLVPLGPARELRRLRELPARTRTTTRLLGPTLRVVDPVSFLEQYEAIFERELYRFVPRRENPVILDCGANIGLLSIYWKRRHPGAHIVAFEPDPELVEVLAANLAATGSEDVEVVPRAVWTDEGEMDFWSEGSDGGRLLWDASDSRPANCRVRTVRLRDSLTGATDMLKLDIEGAEVDVLLDCADRLEQVDHVFVEYHSFHAREQRLDELLQVLRRAGFRTQILPEVAARQPFVGRPEHLGMDLQLNIFGYRT
jgi:FkbM family methyltransferase